MWGSTYMKKSFTTAYKLYVLFFDQNLIFGLVLLIFAGKFMQS